VLKMKKLRGSETERFKERETDRQTHRLREKYTER
jgi:hypothetical protein